MRRRRAAVVAFLVPAVLLACGRRTPQGQPEGSARGEVVVYTAVDQTFSEPLFRAFEQESGIRVRSVYDVEAVKTTGLFTRLLAERDRPRADVFWNNEIARTVQLKGEGVLSPYAPRSAADIPAEFRDPEGYWTGFAARARVIVYNTRMVAPDNAPKTLEELAQPEWRGKVGMANPLFGTAATHAAALFACWGEDRAKAFFVRLKGNDVAVLAGNSTVRDQVADGELAVGLTDTDDVAVGIADGRPIAMVLPDQQGMGTFLIPNTVAIIKGGPNPEGARRLVEYLASADVERQLCERRFAHVAVRDLPKGQAAEERLGQIGVKFLQVDYTAVADAMARSSEFLRAQFLQ